TGKPEWRQMLYERLLQDSVEIDREQWDAATPLVDRWIVQQGVRQAYGDSTLRRLSVDEDPQLSRALDLLRNGRTQADLFALAQRQVSRER
ncbi:MAG TPA: hypothetical protein VMO26_05230, partial [Vicinamibacterales bacterium]|nr:hypothetical protein [Vicinamibacterales bacterium]